MKMRQADGGLDGGDLEGPESNKQWVIGVELKGQPVNKSSKPYFTMLKKHDLTVIP